MSTETPNEVKRLNDLFVTAVNAQSNNNVRNYKKECEEFYYNDVKKTKSQLDTRQKEKVQQTYNIPVSTKFTYATNEQLLAFLTATKPFARMLTTEESTKEFVYAYQKVYHCIWYESKINKNLSNAIRDGLNVGDGYLYVRPAYHEDEATSRVVVEYKPWKHLAIDPESREWDYNDADYMVIMDIMRKSKAEDKYDIKLSDLDGMSSDVNIPNVNELANDFTPISTDKKNDISKYVWIKEYFEKKDKNVYVGEDINTGDAILSLKRPKSIEIPNPDKIKLSQLIMQLEQQEQQLNSNLTTAVKQNDFKNQEASMPVDEQEQTEAGTRDIMDNQDIQTYSTQIQEIRTQLSMLNRTYSEMPDEVPAFEFELEGKEATAISLNTVRNIKKRIQYTLMVGQTILEKKILPCDKYPIINFPFVHFGSPNRVFGNIHYIIDIVKAMNKYISEIMFDIAVNGHRKGFINERSILDTVTFEDDWAQPGKLIKLRTVPDDPNGGMPQILEPSPINQSITYMLEYFKSLIEYITGIYGIIQGDPNSAPSTFGATQSLQTFGTQRIKLYSRNIEHSLENLAYVMVNYIQAFTPRDKLLKYFDENGDQQEVSIMNSKEDMQFKVRVEMTSSLPTTRQMSMQLLAFITQTVSDDALKALYTQYMLKMQDIPEADKMAEDIDIIRSLQGQIQQAQTQIQELTGQVKAAENNMQQMQVANKVNTMSMKADKDIAMMQQQKEMEMENTEIPEEMLSTSLNMAGE